MNDPTLPKYLSVQGKREQNFPAFQDLLRGDAKLRGRDGQAGKV